MKKDEAIDEAVRLVDHYGPMLGLMGWRVRVSYDKRLDIDVVAEILPVEGRQVAVLTIGKTYREEDAWTRRQTIIHELLHCCHHRLTDHIRIVGAKAVKPQRAYDTMWAGVRNEAEHMVDMLSMALVDALPAPDSV